MPRECTIFSCHRGNCELLHELWINGNKDKWPHQWHKQGSWNGKAPWISSEGLNKSVFASQRCLAIGQPDNLLETNIVSICESTETTTIILAKAVHLNDCQFMIADVRVIWRASISVVGPRIQLSPRTATRALPVDSWPTVSCSRSDSPVTWLAAHWKFLVASLRSLRRPSYLFPPVSAACLQ